MMVPALAISGEDLLHGGAHVGTRQGKSEIRLEEARFVTAIEAPSVEAQAEEGALCRNEPRERVGELDLVSGAALEPREMVEHARLQDISAHDAKGRGRVFRRRLFDDTLDLHETPIVSLDIEDAVAVG